jgi:hypothetical protein
LRPNDNVPTADDLKRSSNGLSHPPSAGDIIKGRRTMAALILTAMKNKNK